MRTPECYLEMVLFRWGLSKTVVDNFYILYNLNTTTFQPLKKYLFFWNCRLNKKKKKKRKAVSVMYKVWQICPK